MEIIQLFASWYLLSQKLLGMGIQSNLSTGHVDQEEVSFHKVQVCFHPMPSLQETRMRKGRDKINFAQGPSELK